MSMTTAPAYRPPRVTMPAPRLWMTWLQALGASDRLARETWQRYVQAFPHTSQTVAFHLRLMACMASSEEDARARVAHLERLVRPPDVLHVLWQLSPVDAMPRRLDVVQLEAGVYAKVKMGWPWTEEALF